MEAGATTLRFLGEGKRLTVPFFQRNYVWTESNWKELLESFDNNDDMPFLGSIILKNVTEELKPDEKIIIDGQQRLTTITILAKAIYDSLPKEVQSKSGIAADVKAFLFYRDNAADDFDDSKVKIQHSRLDDEDYKKIIKAGLLPENSETVNLEDIDSTSSGLYRCYKFYRSALENRDIQELKALHSNMFEKDRKVLVLIELSSNDLNEQCIFDTINRAGVRLSTADIIKNNIFKCCLDKCSESGDSKDDVCSLYDEYWDSLFYATQENRQLWDSRRIFGNVERTNLEFLLYCYATIKWSRGRDIFSQMERVYNEIIEELTYNQLKDLIIEIFQYGKLFKKHILDFQINISSPESMPSFKFEDHIDRLLLILEKFGVQMFYPYILMRIKDVDDNIQDPSLVHDFNILESFIIRRRLSSRGVTDYAVKCSQIIHDTSGLRKYIIPELVVLDSPTNDRNFKKYTEEIRNTDTAKILLFCIELHRNIEPKGDIDALLYNYTLEHIMPKKWENKWSDVEVTNEKGLPYYGSDEDKKSVRNKAVHSLGNMLLLKDKLNASIGNSTFDEKVRGNGKHLGYKAYSSLSLTREIVDYHSAGNITWNEKTIYDRMIRMQNEVLEIWPNYSSEIPDTEIEILSNLVEEPTLTIEFTVDEFSDDALKDPIKLLEEMEHLYTVTPKYDVTRISDGFVEEGHIGYGEQQDNSKMINQSEFIRRLSAQAETINRYIREKKILPDVVLRKGEKSFENYYTEDSLHRYANEFGWDVINDDNIYELFINMIEEMTMSYSYKPVFIKAILAKSENNRVSLSYLVDYFINFYSSRRTAGLFVEKDDSVFSKADCSYEDAKDVILQYPYNRFSQRNMMQYDKKNEEIEVSKIIWDNLNEQEKARLSSICDEKLKSYYLRYE